MEDITLEENSYEKLQKTINSYICDGWYEFGRMNMYINNSRRIVYR